jgi:hypothetical protein
MTDNDNDNFKLYRNIEWIGLTIDEAKEKVQKLFDNKVYCCFVDNYRETEQFYFNYITFLKRDNIVVGSMWG